MREAEQLDQHKNADLNYKVNLEEKVALLRQQWGAACKRADEHKETVDKQLDKWREFEGLLQLMYKWIDEIVTHRGYAAPSSASIQGMKVHFEHVKVCLGRGFLSTYLFCTS